MASAEQPKGNAGMDNPDIRPGVENPEIPPVRPAGRGFSLGMPKLLGLGAVAAVVVIGAIMILNRGGSATLIVTGADLDGSWTFSTSVERSEDATLTDARWVESDENDAAGYTDFIFLNLTGPRFSGTQATSEAGIILSFDLERVTDTERVYLHEFVSKAGECQVTMQQGSTGVSGTFTCSDISTQDGKTVTATGSFAT